MTKSRCTEEQIASTLKQLVADLSLDEHILPDVLAEKL